MNLREPDLLTVSDWRRAVAAGAPVDEWLRSRLARLATAGSAPAWISLVPAADLVARLEALLSAAAGLDGVERLRRWPLWGVPFAVKDNIDAVGFDTTAACPAWRRPAAADATVVRRLLDAGAVLLGKTNLDQFATGLVGTRTPYGVPASTFDGGRVSGGSSSGSAVVVARGDVAFSLGTDTAGSGRVPAAFNNLVGVKPTPGRVSTAGVLPACRSLDCVSVFASTVDDASAVLAVIEGPDTADAYSRFRPGRARLPQALRIGVPAAPVVDADLGYDRAWRAAVDRAVAAGATLVPVDTAPLDAVAALLYDGPWVAERWVAVRELIESDPAAMDATVAAVIGGAGRHSAADAFAAQHRLQHLRGDAARLWDAVDLLLVPSVPTHPTLAAVQADPIGVNAALGRYTNFVNLLGWSAVAVPAGFTDGGLPFGVTAIGRADDDAALLHWASAWCDAADRALGATGRRAVLGDRDRAGLPPSPCPATEPELPIAVVGAHLSGLPLNGQLVARGARLLQATRTAPAYRLHALPGTVPPKPGLVRVAEGGAAIDVEVWALPQSQVGSFLAGVAAPLGIGSVELADGRHVHGFLCESAALAGARDITAFGGWRAFLAAR